MSDQTKMKFTSFEGSVLYFNGMYKLPVAPYPTISAVVQDEQKKTAVVPGMLPIKTKSAIIRRLESFRKTLEKEVQEVDDIIASIAGDSVYTSFEFLTDMADWLGDIQIYCASEMVKWGIPQAEVLEIIMASNFSKLQADGTPKYDADGKVEKGPDYWKPEPMIQALLLSKFDDAMSGSRRNSASFDTGEQDE